MSSAVDNKEQLYNLLKESFLLLDFGDRMLIGQFKLTVPRYYAMVHLGEEPGMSLKDLSERMFCDKSNATRIFKGLEGDGYAIRRPHETDGRALRLYLTDKGRDVREKVLAAHRAYNEKRLECISELEGTNMVAGLQMLNESLQEILQENPVYAK